MIWNISAEITAKWFFSSVNKYVFSHIACKSHSLLTKWATKFFTVNMNWDFLKSKILLLKTCNEISKIKPKYFWTILYSRHNLRTVWTSPFATSKSNCITLEKDWFLIFLKSFCFGIKRKIFDLFFFSIYCLWYLFLWTFKLPNWFEA